MKVQRARSKSKIAERRGELFLNCSPLFSHPQLGPLTRCMVVHDEPMATLGSGTLTHRASSIGGTSLAPCPPMHILVQVPVHDIMEWSSFQTSHVMPHYGHNLALLLLLWLS